MRSFEQDNMSRHLHHLGQGAVDTANLGARPYRRDPRPSPRPGHSRPNFRLGTPIPECTSQPLIRGPDAISRDLNQDDVPRGPPAPFGPGNVYAESCPGEAR